jgi:hypothetical protein
MKSPLSSFLYPPLSFSSSPSPTAVTSLPAWLTEVFLQFFLKKINFELYIKLKPILSYLLERKDAICNLQQGLEKQRIGY